MNFLLETRDVVVARDARAIARLPNLQMSAGDTIALVGKSGSGKTTALMALTGIRPPIEGVLFVEQTNLWSLSAAARDTFRGRRIGLVFQSFHLVEALSVADNITLAATCADLPVDMDRLDHLLDRLEIFEIRNIRADRISQGQAQRVAVARAMMNTPAVIVADEPTSALDDEAAAQMLALLKDAAASEGAALVIASHDYRVLQAVASVVQVETVT